MCLCMDLRPKLRTKERTRGLCCSCFSRIGETQLSSGSDFCRGSMCNMVFGTELQIPKESAVNRLVADVGWG